MKQAYVYIMSNKNRSTNYIGVTSNLDRRVLEHKAGIGSSFTSRYYLSDLLYFEPIKGIYHAIKREKQLKNWNKDWKWNLIKQENPGFEDLAKDWYSAEEIEIYKNKAND